MASEDLTRISHTGSFCPSGRSLTRCASYATGELQISERGPGCDSEAHFRASTHPLQGACPVVIGAHATRAKDLLCNGSPRRRVRRHRAGEFYIHAIARAHLTLPRLVESASTQSEDPSPEGAGEREGGDAGLESTPEGDLVS